MELLSDKLDIVTSKLDAIAIDLAKYKGAWGMLVMVGGAIFSLFTIIKKF